MISIDKFILSDKEPNNTNVFWLKPVTDTTFELKVFGSTGWISLSGLKGEKGDPGEQGPAGEPADLRSSLTGLDTSDSSEITEKDTILSAFGKLQGQINALKSGS